MRCVVLLFFSLFLAVQTPCLAAGVAGRFSVANEPPAVLNVSAVEAFVFDANGVDDIVEVGVMVDGEPAGFSVERAACCILHLRYGPLAGNITVYVVDRAGARDSASTVVSASASDGAPALFLTGGLLVAAALARRGD